MGKPLTKPVKIAISIYLAMVLLVCSSYLVLILVGSLQGNDMSSSVLDTDHQHINSVTKDSNEGINDTKLNKASATSDAVAKEETVSNTNDTISNTDTEKVGASSSD
ncbi:hypothetical protein [Staphylococcus haemolyticus]|uniref:hypothetical protein n=1 Tax=Staphylococcus haemolyticus TaxID=1283 RepID=UPI0007556C10|nr:hypothetical protein [Staphylococcus haemolyticus]